MKPVSLLLLALTSAFITAPAFAGGPPAYTCWMTYGNIKKGGDPTRIDDLHLQTGESVFVDGEPGEWPEGLAMTVPGTDVELHLQVFRETENGKFVRNSFVLAAHRKLEGRRRDTLAQATFMQSSMPKHFGLPLLIDETEDYYYFDCRRN